LFVAHGVKRVRCPPDYNRLKKVYIYLYSCIGSALESCHTVTTDVFQYTVELSSEMDQPVDSAIVFIKPINHKRMCYIDFYHD